MSRPGRSWAYAGAVLGGSVSVAANVAHSYVPPTGLGAGWRPPAGAVIGAVFWPVALLVAVEILARVDWPAGARWVAVRFAGLLPVAVVAATVSYRHMSGLLASYREDPWTARTGPIAVDGLMVLSAAALIALGGRTGVPATTEAQAKEGEAHGNRSAAEPAEHDQRPGVGAPTGPGGADVDTPRRHVHPQGSPAAAGEPGPAEQAQVVLTAPEGTDPALLAARQVRDELVRAGVPVTRAALTRGVRAAGTPIGTDRGGDLWRAVLAEENGHATER